MATDEQLQQQSVRAPTELPESDPRRNTAAWVEMGSVSVETKGFVTGFEVSFTPRS
jgi:hypothetical protein